MNRKSIIVAFAAFFIAGCGKDSSSPLADASPPPVVVSPGEGQSGVRLDAGVTLSFSRPVDRAVVERDFHLISERAMADSLCPISTSMNHGTMAVAMADSAKVHHLDRLHAARGGFFWNAGSTECTFRPDSMMSPKTRYMIHLGPDMVGMIETRMGVMAAMSGHVPGVMSKEMMLHFATLDTAASGSGHEGHH